MSGKHAYLIAVHQRFEQLELLLKLLDDSRNDIYLHVDSRTKGFSPERFDGILKQAGLHLVERVPVAWGGSRMIDVELHLLEASVGGKYDYYHHISGMDLPIKSQDVIHAFFNENSGMEFVHFDSIVDEALLEERIGRYHFLQDIVGRTPGFGLWVERSAVRMQKMLGIRRKRYKKGYYKKGANWFSITGEFAEYVLSHRSAIRKDYRFTQCCDEVFLQTLLFHSPFRKHCYYEEKEQRFSNLRLVDWKRGTPYIFCAEDFDELLKSHCMFARKFDIQLDRQIVEKISGCFEKEEL